MVEPVTVQSIAQQGLKASGRLFKSAEKRTAAALESLRQLEGAGDAATRNIAVDGQSVVLGGVRINRRRP